MNVAGVLLAAGVGSRFHGNKHKLLTDVRGESIVGRSARSMVNSGLAASAVVSGSVDLTSALSEFPSLAILHNSAYEEVFQHQSMLRSNGRNKITLMPS